VDDDNNRWVDNRENNRLVDDGNNRSADDSGMDDDWRSIGLSQRMARKTAYFFEDSHLALNMRKILKLNVVK
jgi:hypothetical protein